MAEEWMDRTSQTREWVDSKGHRHRATTGYDPNLRRMVTYTLDLTLAERLLEEDEDA